MSNEDDTGESKLKKYKYLLFYLFMLIAWLIASCTLVHLGLFEQAKTFDVVTSALFATGSVVAALILINREIKLKKKVKIIEETQETVPLQEEPAVPRPEDHWTENVDNKKDKKKKEPICSVRACLNLGTSSGLGTVYALKAASEVDAYYSVIAWFIFNIVFILFMMFPVSKVCVCKRHLEIRLRRVQEPDAWYNQNALSCFNDLF